MRLFGVSSCVTGVVAAVVNAAAASDEVPCELTQGSGCVDDSTTLLQGIMETIHAANAVHVTTQVLTHPSGPPIRSAAETDAIPCQHTQGSECVEDPTNTLAVNMEAMHAADAVPATTKVLMRPSGSPLRMAAESDAIPCQLTQESDGVEDSTNSLQVNIETIRTAGAVPVTRQVLTPTSGSATRSAAANVDFPFKVTRESDCMDDSTNRLQFNMKAKCADDAVPVSSQVFKVAGEPEGRLAAADDLIPCELMQEDGVQDSTTFLQVNVKAIHSADAVPVTFMSLTLAGGHPSSSATILNSTSPNRTSRPRGASTLANNLLTSLQLGLTSDQLPGNLLQETQSIALILLWLLMDSSPTCIIAAILCAAMVGSLVREACFRSGGVIDREKL